ncbi:MAG: Flagellar P-ring protein [Nitrospirae bacterium]|nr:MAG: flagellar P-ring protein FlgI [Nitrospira sp. OLB3]MBV6470502.1 Flagellar P-ring protein [Nitrospirota bacterium]MCK6494043.1 flagellar basal body P-ring protein FlgI [Nitrospira sp.]MCK6497951.1 flagellar basal body P-ring protein FlgI [Nitrospira sp.]MEB2338591.1 flagellar basal body P-ring protein FlgI [Nitrospirales bacterium]
MSTQRKEQQQLIIQCFRLMLASGVVRTADLDPESLPRHWSSPLPTPQRKQPERQQAGTWFRRAFVGMAAFLMLSLLTASWAEAVRVKDVATIEGVRENQLIGYGLVVGLDRTGDQVIGGQFTIQAMMSMLNKMGINLVIDPIQLLTRNIASVMVTAKLPPFVKPGMTLDAVVSSMANAKSLQGGTLLLTPLKAPNQQVFAVAQGPVSIGGFLGGVGGAGGATVTKNHQAAGVVPAGAIVEKELVVDIDSWDSVSVLLRHPDFTTAIRTAEAIDGTFGKGTAVPVNAGLVKAALPTTFQGRVVEYIATMEGLDVTVDVAAKVVVNERTGTVVLGEHVRLSTCAISHGNLTISVKNTLNVSQPPAPIIGSTMGQTTVTPDVQTEVKEQESRLVVVDQTVTLGDVVRALNAVGVTPRDLVAILSALRAAGALQANLEIV